MDHLCRLAAAAHAAGCLHANRLTWPCWWRQTASLLPLQQQWALLHGTFSCTCGRDGLRHLLLGGCLGKALAQVLPYATL